MAAGVVEARLPPQLRGAAVALCALDTGPTSVTALCALLGVHRRTLWYQWRTRVRGSTARLEDAIIAVVLLRASVRWAAGASWQGAAAAVGVHRHTLARAARRAEAPGLPPRGDAHADAVHAAVRRLVLENVARPLLRGQALRAAEAHAVARP